MTQRQKEKTELAVRMVNKRKTIGPEDTATQLSKMLQIDRELYEKILDTPNFAYHFNQLCLKAEQFDYIQMNGFGR